MPKKPMREPSRKHSDITMISATSRVVHRASWVRSSVAMPLSTARPAMTGSPAPAMFDRISSRPPGRVNFFAPKMTRPVKRAGDVSSS